MMRDAGHNFLWDGKRHVCQKCNLTPAQASGYGRQIMPCRPGRGFDLCECGDYRHQHEGDAGPCRLNVLGHGGAPSCHKFTMSKS